MYPHVFSGQVQVEEVEDPFKLRLRYTFGEPFTLQHTKMKDLCISVWMMLDLLIIYLFICLFIIYLFKLFI